MATTAGIVTVLGIQANAAQLSSAAATGGAAPYTYQWYRSVTPGFTPGGGSILTGKTALTLNDTGLIPNTTYYYKLVSTDSGAVSATSAQTPIVTAAPSMGGMNQFGQRTIVGQVDLKLSFNTVAVQIDATQATPLYFGAPVKILSGAGTVGGVPKVVGIAADTDEVYGYINYDAKTQQFKAGSLAEISMAGNAIYLYATTAIGRGKQVTSNFNPGGVSLAVGSSGKAIVGWAYDEAVNPGDLIRVILSTPSFRLA